MILDSPLASRFTRVYRDLERFWPEEARERIAAGRKPLAFEQRLIVDDHAAHQRMVHHLAETRRPAIVIAASGMCIGGRIVNYLKAMLGDPRHNVLFVGCQAAGTPGRDIQTHGPKGGYSAHADQTGLIEFVTGMTTGRDRSRSCMVTRARSGRWPKSFGSGMKRRVGRWRLRFRSADQKSALFKRVDLLKYRQQTAMTMKC